MFLIYINCSVLWCSHREKESLLLSDPQSARRILVPQLRVWRTGLSLRKHFLFAHARLDMMVVAFAFPTLPLRGVSRSATSPLPWSCSRRPVRMATVSRPANIVLDDDNEPKASAPVHRPEIAAVAAAVCEFMNTEHVRDIANYVVRFGRKFNDLSQLSQVKMSALDAAGFTAEIVSCDETNCVCVQERLDWPLGLCASSGDIINALKHLSLACGLPADF